MLGAGQKQWLKQEMLAARGVYPLIVWVGSVPWIGSSSDGWHSFSNERAELADFIADNGIEGLVMLSGDAHMLAIDDGTNSDYSQSGSASFPVFHAAALDRPGSVKGGPYSHGTFPGGGQFGLMTVTDDGVNPICVQWSGRDASDVEIVGLTFCQPSPPPADTDDDGFDDIEECAFDDDGLWERPSRVSGVNLQRSGVDGVELVWDSQDSTVGPSTSYDVVSGMIDELRQDRGYARAGCLADDHPDSPLADLSGEPAPGQTRYYLVRAHNACGSVGYGESAPIGSRVPMDSHTPCTFP